LTFTCHSPASSMRNLPSIYTMFPANETETFISGVFQPETFE
jgi:hypothetical protein